MGKGKASATWFGFGLIMAILMPRPDGLIESGPSNQPELVDLLKGARPVEGRMSELSYAPFPSSIAAEEKKRYMPIARTLVRESKTTTLPPLIRDSAIISLLYDADFGRGTSAAQQILERGVRLYPQDSRLLSALSAVYIAEGAIRPEYYIKALESARRAVNLDPQYCPALFNLALAQDYLFLPSAREAWLSYLKEEKGLAWKEEAQLHLERCSSPGFREKWEGVRRSIVSHSLRGDESAVFGFVSKYAHPARMYGEEELLYGWAKSISDAKEEEAHNALVVARSIGSALSFESHDSMLSEEVALIEAVPTRSDVFYKLVKGHLEFGIGLQFYQRRDAASAKNHFGNAYDDLKYAGSPFALWARFYFAACDYFEGRYGNARAIFASLEPQAARYKSLLGRVRWSLGLTVSVAEDFGASQSMYQSALAIFTELHEDDYIAILHSLISENLDLLGQQEAAWRERYDALRHSYELYDPLWLHNIYFLVADAARREGDVYSALYFQDAMVQLAYRLSVPGLACEARIERMKTLFKIGGDKREQEKLRDALRCTENLNNKALAERFLAEILLAKGEWLISRNPNEAIQPLTEALRFYQRKGYIPRQLEASMARARAYTEEGSWALAQLDIDTALREIEEQRLKLSYEPLRDSYLGASKLVFNEMLRFQIKSGKDPEEAFRTSELSRARTLVDYLSSKREIYRPISNRKSETIMSVVDIQRSLPPNTVIVEYGVLDEALIIWIIRSDGFWTKSVAIAKEPLEAIIANLRRESESTGARRDTQALREILSDLFDVLVLPAKDLILQGESVVFVPDGVLYSVPFSALFSRGEGAYFIQGNAVITCPSATSFIQLSLARGLRRKGQVNALILGNPTYSKSLLPDLSRLNGAEQEAIFLASLYKGSQLLLEGDATKEAFLRLGSMSEIVHFGGHAITGVSGDPSLLFSPSKANGGWKSISLQSWEVARAKWRRTKLVVLGGCGTAGGRRSSEGEALMARAFLSTGVLTVIVTVWPIDDVPASELLSIFHGKIREGEDPVKALRLAQLSLLQSDRFNSPIDWAGFQVTGSGLLWSN